MTTLDRRKALDLAISHMVTSLTGGPRTFAEAREELLDLALALPAQPVAVCSVKTMKLSDGREDYYVSILIEGREITPHVFRIKGRAEFEVETWKWLFGQGEEPNIMDWLDRTADPAKALAPAPSQWEAIDKLLDALQRYGFPVSTAAAHALADGGSLEAQAVHVAALELRTIVDRDRAGEAR